MTATASFITGNAPVVSVPLSEELAGSLRLMKPLDPALALVDRVHGMVARGLMEPATKRNVRRGGKHRVSTRAAKVKIVEFPRKVWVPPTEPGGFGSTKPLSAHENNVPRATGGKRKRN
jgi:hypothetical protein